MRSRTVATNTRPAATDVAIWILHELGSGAWAAPLDEAGVSAETQYTNKCAMMVAARASTGTVPYHFWAAGGVNYGVSGGRDSLVQES